MQVTSEARPKRVRAGFKRTNEWLDACLKEQEKRGIKALPFAAVSGGIRTVDRMFAAQAVADKPVAGERRTLLWDLVCGAYACK